MRRGRLWSCIVASERSHGAPGTCVDSACRWPVSRTACCTTVPACTLATTDHWRRHHVLMLSGSIPEIGTTAVWSAACSSWRTAICCVATAILAPCSLIYSMYGTWGTPKMCFHSLHVIKPVQGATTGRDLEATHPITSRILSRSDLACCCWCIEACL